MVVHRSVFYSSAAHLALASKACSVRFSRCPPGSPSALRRCCDANEHITRIFTACQRISESFLRNFSEGRQGPERGTRKASGRGPARGSPCGLRKPPGVPPGRLPLRAHDTQNRPLCCGCANEVCAPTETLRTHGKVTDPPSLCDLLVESVDEQTCLLIPPQRKSRRPFARKAPGTGAQTKYAHPRRSHSSVPS